MPEARDADQRLLWIRAYASAGDARAVCDRFGISRPTLRKWWARYQRLGQAGLATASTAPHRSPQRRVFEAETAAIRALHADGFSPARIRTALLGRGLALSVSTIRRALAEPRQPVSHAAPADTAGLFDTMLPDDSVFRSLTDRITDGAVRVGDVLEVATLAREHRSGRRAVWAALRSLASIGLVRLERSAATVTAPRVEAIAEAYAARRLVESAVARSLADTAGPADIAVLRQHVRRQADAERRGDRVSFVRLLTDFHLLLAALTGNDHLQSFVRSLASVTAVGVLLDDQDAAQSCAVDDHRALIRLIEAGDAEGVARLMAEHLTHNHHRQRRRGGRETGAAALAGAPSERDTPCGPGAGAACEQMR